MGEKKYRLITRSDMDGLVCGTLLSYLDLIDDILFVHPKDMQDGLIEVSSNDITTNVPYVEGVHLAFDHHFSETLRNEKRDNHIINPDAPSAAQVVYDFYGGDEEFPMRFIGMMNGANKADSADFTQEDILEPRAWALLSFIMDSRTGLGRFKDFEVSNKQLMRNLIDYCAKHNIDEILEIKEVKERVDLYFKYEKEFQEQLKKCTKIYGNVVVVDYKDEEIIYPGNRFLVYAMYPEVNVSIHISYTFDRDKLVFSTGKSIINKTSNTNIGELMLKHGGGGHKAAGGCQIPLAQADQVLEDIIAKLNQDG
ncbi:MAG: exopolyphosphatase [Arcobacter sp.]|uniref:exopolyphosphatase n=1 Tax=uncultured Arcobacter sp. TaxID=165434 RepID=UPI000CB81846|nr:exopolyphosphatase [uncultured Arcobacter sp.]PLY10048.1 MAG: exopolyphosphatase [Arcobacter sp.]